MFFHPVGFEKLKQIEQRVQGVAWSGFADVVRERVVEELWDTSPSFNLLWEVNLRNHTRLSIWNVIPRSR